MSNREDVENKKNPPEEVASALASMQGSGDSKLDEENDDEKFEIPQRFTKSGRKRAVPFPLKLMKVLSNKEFEHVITWMPSGKSFSIVESKTFVAEILPEHFKSAKYASFTRKLHRWGFMRHYRGEEAGAFYHKYFQKDHPELVDKMTCHKMEPQAVRKTPKRAGAEFASASTTKPSQSGMVSQPPVQQKQILLQQPTDVVTQLQQRLSLSGLQDHPMGPAERLNAAIELEVARRLKERIQAAAISRHTLALMNQFNQPAPAPTNMQWNGGMNGSLQAQLLQIQQQKHQLELSVASQMDNKGLEQLPDTNIQGAKTA